MLLVEWMAARVRPRRRRIELGDSHTRWIALDGSVRRAYVHRFSGRGLAREIRRGGFRASGVGAGLYPLRPLPGRSARAEG